MKFPTLPPLDAAAAIACGTGTLYLLGLANIQGDALALQLPFLLLKREAWDTISMGTERVLMTLFAPWTVLFAGGKTQWQLVGILLQAVVVGLVIHLLFRKRAWGGSILILWLLASLYWYVLWASMAFMNLHIDRSTSCLVNRTACDLRVQLAQIEYLTVADRIEVREGALLLASNEFVILHTAQGVLAVPKSGIRAVRSTRSSVQVASKLSGANAK